MNAAEERAQAELDEALGTAEMSYGHGGVPWFLLIGYLAFLTFFTWYVLEYQLPDYLDQGPGRASAVEQASGASGEDPPTPPR